MIDNLNNKRDGIEKDIESKRFSKNFLKILKYKLKKVLSDENIDYIENSLNKLSLTDLFTWWRFIIGNKIISKNDIKYILREIGDKFTYSKSNIDILKLLEIEKNFVNRWIDNKFKYIEVSPLNPLGTSYIVGKSSPQKVLFSLNGKELISDPTYSLTLECVRQIKQKKNVLKINQNLSFITISTAVRNQNFSNPFYMPYFKVGSGITVLNRGVSLKNYDLLIADIINNHLLFLNEIKHNFGKIRDIKLQLSHGKILYKLISSEKRISLKEASNLVYDYKKRYGNSFSSNIFKDLGLKERYIYSLDEINNSKYSRYFKNITESINLSLVKNISIEINFSRTAGLGHYDNIIFTIFISNDKGKYTDIIDGGGVNWINELLNTKGYKQIVFGSGLELLTNFISD